MDELTQRMSAMKIREDLRASGLPATTHESWVAFLLGRNVDCADTENEEARTMRIVVRHYLYVNRVAKELANAPDEVRMAANNDLQAASRALAPFFSRLHNVVHSERS